jgi:carbon monoxide dehydrogenase subunit G
MMLINNEFEVDRPVADVWAFFEDIPQVAACLPGAQLTEDLGDDSYRGTVAIRMGPVRMSFAGTAKIIERDLQAKRVVVDASGSDERGRGQAHMLVTATLSPARHRSQGTQVAVAQDLQLSGAAAQYGRGMISDVSAVLMRSFAANMQARIGAPASDTRSAAPSAAPAGGFGIALSAARMALMRVFSRFFLPYRPHPS